MMFGSADNYCDRCGRDCNCTSTSANIVVNVDPAPIRRFGQRMSDATRRASKALHGMAMSFKPFLEEIPEATHWREAAWHPWGPIPVVHLDQGVPSPRWREYQRRP